ncbi:unnamed protein product, partial [marine sediment metagenome]
MKTAKNMIDFLENKVDESSLRTTKTNKKNEKKFLVQYLNYGKTKIAVPENPKTQSILEAGIYHISTNIQGQAVYKKTELLTDELIKLGNESYSYIMEEIDKFWKLKEKFDDFGYVHKRGMILHGVPGTGKTALTDLITEQMEEQNDISFIAKDSGSLISCLKQFREVEPDRKVLVIMEEFEEMIRYGERTLLQLLDGQSQLGGVFYI